MRVPDIFAFTGGLLSVIGAWTTLPLLIFMIFAAIGLIVALYKLKLGD